MFPFVCLTPKFIDAPKQKSNVMSFKSSVLIVKFYYWQNSTLNIRMFLIKVHFQSGNCF